MCTCDVFYKSVTRSKICWVQISRQSLVLCCPWLWYVFSLTDVGAIHAHCVSFSVCSDDVREQTGLSPTSRSKSVNLKPGYKSYVVKCISWLVTSPVLELINVFGILLAHWPNGVECWVQI